MGMELEEGLRSLCCQYGWFYGVYWQVANAGDGDPDGLLTVKVTYCEEQLGKVVDHMLQQVENEKERVIVAAASREKHWWLFSDLPYITEQPDKIKDDELWTDQFSSGIKTIAVIPLPARGVVMFGSCDKILESVKFINHVHHTFKMPQILSSESSTYSAARIAQNNEVHHPCNASVYGSESGSFSTQNGIICLQSMHEECTDLALTFEEVHHFASADSSHKNCQPSMANDELIASLASRYQQDFSCPTLSPLPTYQLPNNSIDDFSNFERQIFELAEFQDVPEHFFSASSVTSYHGETVPIETLSGCESVEPGRTGLSNTEQFSIEPQPFALQQGSYCGHFSGENCLNPEPSSELVSMLTLHKDHAAEFVASTASKSYGPMKDDDIWVSSASSGYSRVVETMTNPEDGPATHPSCRDTSAAIFSDSDLFDSIELDLRNFNQRSWDDIMIPEESGVYSTLRTSVLNPVSGFGVDAIAGPSKDCFFTFAEEQLVEVASRVEDISTHNPGNQGAIVSNMTCTTSCRTQVLSSGLPCLRRNTSIPDRGFEMLLQGSTSTMYPPSQVGSWIDVGNSMNAVGGFVTMQSTTLEEPLKIVRKRARPGESIKPRPKDRQLIQERVKELREIVPNSAKCSIDALLDRTIKHMLYLRSLTKYADKLKQADEPKLIGEDSGIILRDNSCSGGGGATWAFEVAGQTMVCPILVENLSPPGQMLIEMLCEDRGLFLEIADAIRGFGLTILKGVLEVRDSKIWSRFLVEASGNVTRMEIFLSLVHLLQQANNGINMTPSKDIDDSNATLRGFQQATRSFPMSLAGNLP